MNRKKTKIILWLIGILGITFVFLYFFLGLNVLLLNSSSAELPSRGTVSSQEFMEHYKMQLPQEALSVDYFQDEWHLFARIKLYEVKVEEQLLMDFQKMCLRNSTYKKYDLASGMVPACNSEWWDLVVIEKCEYYKTEMEYTDPRFWVDRDSKYIYMFIGN